MSSEARGSLESILQMQTDAASECEEPGASTSAQAPQLHIPESPPRPVSPAASAEEDEPEPEDYPAADSELNPQETVPGNSIQGSEAIAQAQDIDRVSPQPAEQCDVNASPRNEEPEDLKRTPESEVAVAPAAAGKPAQSQPRREPARKTPSRQIASSMKKAVSTEGPTFRSRTVAKKTSSMMRINQQPSLHQESFGEGIKTGPSGSDNDSDSEVSDAEMFLAKGAFLLTPSHELSLEKASSICEKMNFAAPFSLTKTATGILFKFARPEDYQATFKKGFHKVTGARFYKKIPIPCRPQKTFTVFVLEVPEEVPEEDIRHALYKFHSVVEVVRLAGTGGAAQLAAMQKDAPAANSAGATVTKPDKAIGSTASGSTVELGTAGPPPLIRVTLASLDEYNLLLQNGLDFYGATYFPTEAASPGGVVRVHGRKSLMGNRILDVVTASGQRVRDLLPVFDSAGFSKIPPPAMKTIKPRPN